jgi:predicted DNA-binding transcriptional regulator AlpA
MLPRLLEIDEVAELTRLSRNVLSVMRMKGRGPVFVKIGKKILYPEHELVAYIERNTHTAGADRGGAREAAVA